MMMSTYVHLIDLKRWFIECHIFMPKKAFDHGKTEIYKIIHVDPDIDLSYVGHTTNFVQREKNHKYNCEHYVKYYTYANDNNVYGVIRDNGGWKNFKWSLLKSGLVRLNVKLLRESNIGLKF